MEGSSRSKVAVWSAMRNQRFAQGRGKFNLELSSSYKVFRGYRYRKMILFYLTGRTLTPMIVVTMTEKISTVQIRQRLGAVLSRVALRNDQFIIERKGKPLAAVVPVERFEQMRRAARMHLLRVLEREGKPTEAQAERRANEAKHRTRKARRR